VDDVLLILLAVIKYMLNHLIICINCHDQNSKNNTNDSKLEITWVANIKQENYINPAHSQLQSADILKAGVKFFSKFFRNCSRL